MQDVTKNFEELIKSKIQSKTEIKVSEISEFVDILRNQIAIIEEKSAFNEKLIANVNEAVISTDLYFNILTWNKTAEKIYGWKEDEVKNKNLFNIIETEYISSSFDECLQILEDNNSWSGEVIHRTKNARTISILSTVKYLFDSENNKFAIISVNRDITKRKKVEEKNLKLYRAVEYSPASIVITDIKGTIEYVNPKFTEVTGFSFEEAIGQNPNILKSGKMTPETYKELWEKLNAGSEWRGELLNKKKNGELFWEMASISALKNEKDETTHFIAVKENIDHKKKTEEELKNNEKRLSSLVEILQYNADSIHILLDFSLEQAIKLTQSKIGYIYFYNEKTKIFTLNSWSKDVMNECTVAKKQGEYELDKTGIWGEAVRQRKPIILNSYLDTNNLKKGYPEGHAELKKFLTIPVISENRIVAVIGVANKETDYIETDVLQLKLLMDSVWKVVERKQFELEIQEKNKTLTELNATKDKFFSIIAHDLKNPFSAILGFSELLIQSSENYKKEDILQFSHYINNATNQAYKLLENLLEWSKIQRGQLKPEISKYNLKNICDEVLLLLVETAANKKIVLKNLITENVFAECDANMTKTIMRNLISNAIKFTKKGGSVTIQLEEKDNKIEVSVSDTGVGIPVDILPKLFKIENSVTTKGTESESGTGLGLMLCKELVEKQGGRINVESSEGKGSTFYFTLPK